MRFQAGAEGVGVMHISSMLELTLPFSFCPDCARFHLLIRFANATDFVPRSCVTHAAHSTFPSIEGKGVCRAPLAHPCRESPRSCAQKPSPGFSTLNVQVMRVVGVDEFSSRQLLFPWNRPRSIWLPGHKWFRKFKRGFLTVRIEPAVGAEVNVFKENSNIVGEMSRPGLSTWTVMLLDLRPSVVPEATAHRSGAPIASPRCQ